MIYSEDKAIKPGAFPQLFKEWMTHFL